MTDAGLAHVLGCAALIERRVRQLVSARRAVDPAPDDPFRGLYLSDEAVDVLLDAARPRLETDDSDMRRGLAEEADAAQEAGIDVPLRRLQGDAGLTDLDVELLVIALLPDVDSRFEGLYGYLNDDVTRRRASVGLALELAGRHAASAEARARLGALAPLRSQLLLEVEDADRPFLTRALRVPDRVVGHLLAEAATDPALATVTASPTPYDCETAVRIAQALGTERLPVYLRDGSIHTGASIAAAALARLGRRVVGIDLTRCAAEGDPDEFVALAGREALLLGAGVVAEPVEALESSPRALSRLARLPVPVLIVGHATWDPSWTRHVPMLVEAPEVSADERAQMWATELSQVDSMADASAVTAQFVLGPEQTTRAVEGARAAALLDGEAVTVEHLRRGARAQNAAGLERLSRRIQPGVGWDDLVLPGKVESQLHDLSSRARHRDLVLREWRMRPGGGRGKGLTALFAGDSGTGKTMSAEVIAADLGLDLYAVNLATVVDKYVGETEKNLERIFGEASGVNAVLLFDEADAVFGKRSEVRDAHDRYANIESAYLLQRMESFDGLAILSSNLRANIDEAFTRRLDAIVDFPTPDEPLRLELWRRCLAPPLPTVEGLDLDFCARSFELSGGNIRSVAITAAYLAAARSGPVTMDDIVAALHQEYRKLGRLVVEREFGPYLSALG